MASHDFQEDYNTTDARAECESYIRAAGYMLQRSGWTDRGYGDAGDRKSEARLLTAEGKDAAIMAHFFDGSTTGHPFCHFHAHGRRTLDDWKPDGEHRTPIQQISPEEQQRRAEEQRRKDEQNAAKNAAQLAADIEAYYHTSQALPDAPRTSTGIKYLIRKKTPLDVSPFLRIAKEKPTGYPDIPQGALIVPFYDVRMPLDLLFTRRAPIIYFQWITDDRKYYRVNWTGRKAAKGIVFWIGDPRTSYTISLVEGLVTGAAWYKASGGMPTGVCCNVDRLKETAELFLTAAQWRKHRLILASDDDHITAQTATPQGTFNTNKGISTAQALQRAFPERVYIATPPWQWDKIDFRALALKAGDDIKKASDWNDYLVIRGEEAAHAAAADRLKKALEYFQTQGGVKYNDR